MNSFPKILIVILLLLSACVRDMELLTVENAFVNPPETAKPWTWWHWIDGNITREGITHDLEAMSRAGLGGALIFNVKLGLPDGPVRFMTDEWLEMLDHAAAECDRLGMKLGIHNCDGWSQAGGPWITPELSMKKLSWSKTEVQGPVRFNNILPRPPVPETPLVEDFYRDIAMIAYPAPEGRRINGPASGIQLSGSLSEDELKQLVDDDPYTRTDFPLRSHDQLQSHHILMRFPHPVSARSLVLHGIEGYTLPQVIPGTLEVSDNGSDFREVATFELNWGLHDSPMQTISIAFPETRASIFRIRFRAEHAFTPAISLSEIELSTRQVVHYWEAKAGWARQREHGGEAPFLSRDPGPEVGQMTIPAGSVVPYDQVYTFTGKLSEDGRFEWEVPEGDWIILRMGYTSTGRTNSPATDEGRGLEADKMNRDAVRFHMDQFIGKMKDRYGAKNLESFSVFETDSWESGVQNWTKGFEKRFSEVHGQDLVHWLPLITEGILVEGYEESDRLLWDWRRFLADEIAESYFQVTADFAEEHGLTYVAEASGRQMFMYDPISYQRISPVPMGEFWVSKDRGQGVRVDNKVAASAAHLTGRKLVASESYTSPPESSRWTQHPFTLKALGDKAFCEGVNKFVFHTYAHQPYPELKPGFTMGRWGMQNHSGNTWWNGPVEGWFGYIARCQYLLQEGRFHADILAYLGEEVPSRVGRREEFNPAIPQGYDFDACDFQTLLEARVDRGELVLPSGMRYRVLLLPDKHRMRRAVVERIVELSRKGALILSPVKPDGSPSYSELGETDRQIQKLVSEYWLSSIPESGDLEGKVLSAGDDLGALLPELGILPDFSYETADPADVPYIHRIIGGSDFYFLSNQQDHALSIEALFRQSGKRFISLWDPATGKKYRPLEVLTRGEDQTALRMELDPYGSVFVVFSDREVEVEPSLVEQNQKTLEGFWEVHFPAGSGAPSEPLLLEELMDLSTHEDFGVRHFSGTASYRTALHMEEGDLEEGRHYMLDLGEVKEMAEVRINNQRAEMLWKPPFRADISSLLKPGYNLLEVRVTNLWVNRLIGDEYFPDETVWKNAYGAMIVGEWPDWLIKGEPRPESDRISWSTRGKDWSKDDPLLPSGLLGPVRLIASLEENAN